MSRKTIAVLLMSAVAAVAGGCGDDDDDDNGGGGGGGESLTQAEYVKRADRICAQANREVDREAERVFGDLDREPPREDIVAFIEETAIPNLKGQIADLKELPVPEGDEETVDAIYDAADEAIAELEANPEELTNEQSNVFDEANRLAQDYGMKVCGEED